MTELRERDWSPTMIRDFLGEPDEVGGNMHRRGAVSRLYDADRVEGIEQREDFIRARTIVINRKIAAKRRAKGTG